MVSKPTPPPKPPATKHRTNIMTGITLAGQMPALEHAKAGHAGFVWRVWLSYDEKYKNGVFLKLCENGTIFRCVVRDGQIKKTELIKDRDR